MTHLIPYDLPGGPAAFSNVVIPPCLQDEVADGWYAMAFVGPDLEPEICDGDFVLVSPEAPPRPGDFITIWWVNRSKPIIERLAMALPDAIGDKVHPESELIPLVVVERLHPPKRGGISADRVIAAHKVIGVYSTAAEPGWQDDGLYLYRWPSGDTHMDVVKVRTKKGALRKAPLGRIRYSQGDGEAMSKVSFRLLSEARP